MTIGTTTLRQPQLLYASSRTTRSGGMTTGSGTTNDDDGLHFEGSHAGTFILARKQGILGNQAKKA